MPNWVTTIVNFEGKQEDIDTIFDLIKGSEDDEDSVFDFNRLIPMPTELDVEDGSRGKKGLVYLYNHADNEEEKDLIAKIYSNQSIFGRLTEENEPEDIDEEAIKIAEQYISNYKKYGHCTWYHWAINNWGTKWNASCPNRYGNCLEFNTAWGFAEPIMSELAELCGKHNVTFSGYFCDEDYGSGNKGTFDCFDDGSFGYEYNDGDIYDESVKEILVNCYGEDFYEEALSWLEENEDD